uniref:Uncharacterized protein n=1 Tax=Rhodnius prolixus TaxID=13249 RepID=T1HXC3_RHOPR
MDAKNPRSGYPSSLGDRFFLLQQILSETKDIVQPSGDLEDDKPGNHGDSDFHRMDEQVNVGLECTNLHEIK